MKKLELPDIRQEEVVAFHYEPGRGVERVVLQVPSEDGSSTYRLNLRDPVHYRYVSSLPNGKRIIDVLRIEGHLAVRPKTGEYLKLEDTDAAASSGLNAAVVQALGAFRDGRRPRPRPWEIPTLRG